MEQHVIIQLVKMQITIKLICTERCKSEGNYAETNYEDNCHAAMHD